MKRKLSFLMLFMAFCSFAIGQTTPYWGENHAGEYELSMAYALVVNIDGVYQATDQLEVAPYYDDKRVGEPVRLLKAPDQLGGKYVADGIINAENGKQIKFKMYNYDTGEFFGFSDNYITFVAEAIGNITDPFELEYTSVAEVNEAKYGNFQNAVNAAADGQTVKLNKDVVGDVLITQTANVSITIDGNDKSFTGIMKVFGNGNQNGEETLTIKNINFIAKEGADACIVSPEKNTIVYNSFSYSHNVTVINCTFTDLDGTVNCAAIRHEDGGDKNWTVKNCTVTSTMHSLLQVNNVINKLVVDGCTVNSKNGVNLNSCTNVEFTNNVFNVQGYALRSGVASGGNLGETKTYVLNNNKLQSACNDGDAVIMFRASSVDAKFTMDKNVIKGDRHISGNTADTKFNADANYWDGENTPRSTTPIVVTTYYLDEALTQLARNAMGNTIIGYTSAQGIWSETWGNAVESYVVKALDADGNVMGTTSLNNIGGIIDGDVTVTWNLKLDAASNTDVYWAMSWTTAPTINNMPKKVQLWIDGVNVSEGPVVLNGPDGQNPIFAAKTDAAGKIISYIACDGFNLNNANYVLQHSIADGDNIAILVAGTYKVPTGKDVTITGAVDGVVFDNIGACGMAGADVTFNNVTFDYYPNVNYTGLQHSGNLVYNNCTINGQVFLYGEKETFNNCKFNQNSSDAYNVWTYGAKEVVFNGCTFNSAGKSVLIYAEGESIFNDVTVTGCTFNATASVEGKAAIEMDSSHTSGIELTITNTTAEGFGTGNISGNSLWNNKKGNEGDNNDITVIVDGVTVLAPEYEAQIGDVKYQHLTDAITAAQPGETVEIFAGTFTQNLDITKAITVVGERDDNNNNLVTFNGKLNITAAGATAKNLNVNNGSSTAGYINAKDVLVEGCDVTGGDGFRYCYTAGTVTFKDSKITGATYGIHFDGSAGGNIVIDNCEITGWTSFAGTITNVAITNTDFLNGTYNQLRFYQNAQMTNCTFNPNMTIDFGKNEVDAEFTACSVTDGSPLTDVIYLGDIAEMGVDVTINDEPVIVEAKVADADGNNTKYYLTLAEAIDAAQNQTVTVLEDVVLTQGLTIAAGKVVTLDLNGKVVSGTCNTTDEHNAHLIAIENTADLTIIDSSDSKEGKVTYKSGTGNIGFTIDVKGNLILESGTIELTGQWSLGFAVDIRPNAWATAYTESTSFTMNGGKVVSSDTGVRVDSNSSDSHPALGVYFKMNGGEIISEWDALFIQHRYRNDLYVEINGDSKISGKNSPLRIFGDNVISDVNVKINGGTFDYTGEDGTTGWIVENFLKGTSSVVAEADIEITGGTFDGDVTEFCAFNYVCTQNTDGTYGVQYKPQQNNAFVIATLHELEAFRDAVNAGNTFEGDTVVLSGDVNLAVTRAINNWEPIGTQANPFKGTFDGGNKTISNLVVVGENNVGLFGYATSATIKNVKLENVNVKGTDCVGAIAGQVFSTSLIDNCHVSGSIQVEGQTNVGGIVGKYYTKVKNCSVIGDDVATSYVKGTYVASDLEGDNIAGIMGHGGENNTFTNNTVKNITISGTRKVGGIVGVTDQNTDVTNCVVENVNIVTTATAEYAEANKTKAGHAPIVGSYTSADANNNGTVIGCTVKNVTFVNDNNVTASFGPITGGARGGTNGMLAPSTDIVSEGNLIYMSTITVTTTTGTTTNMYLMNPVAKIGETEYYTLFDAVKAAQGETTIIILISNTSEEFAINNTETAITLDLNGNELTGAILPSNAKLTVKNGTIVNKNSSVSAIEINAGSLTLNEDVTIESARHAVRIDGNVTATINGGNYKVKDYDSGKTQHAVNVSGTATVTILGGTFVGPKGTTADSGSAVNVKSGATVTINGGEFSGGKNHTLSAAGTLIVKGGKFDQDPSAYLADAYTVNIENEMYVVRYTPIMVTYPVGNPVYPEGKVEYYSDMLEAVPYTTNCPRLEGATITLLADVSGEGMRFMENDMVFDLNGHTYTITDGTGSQGTNTSGFQIRPEVTTNVLFKDGTIKVAEGAPVVWMFNCYATDFIVENVTVDCSNMAYSYGGNCYVVVSREGDNVKLTGETKIVNFNSDVAGNAINVGDTMTIGEDVDLGGGTIELDGGAQLTAPAGLTVVTVDGYMVVYENGVYKSVKVVAQVGDNKFGSVIAALNYAIANNAAQVKIVSDSRELMPTDVELILNADLEITAEQPYTVKFYNNGTYYDFVVGSNNSNTLTFGENVTFQLEDRIIWLGYYGNDVDVVVNGTLAASQIWHGADTKVTSTGTIKSTGEAFVMRRGATLKVNGGKVNANYFNILAGDILAESAEITCGAMWIANTGSYANEGNVNINIKSSTLTSNGNLESSTAHTDGVSINFENSEVTFVLFDGYRVSSIDANTVLNVKGTNAAVSIKGLTNNGLVNVTETAKLTLTGTVTNNGAMKLDATSVIYAPENLGVTIDDNDYDVVYENGAYRAVHKPFVAEVDGTQFTSLQRAFDAVQDNGTITLLRDVTFDLTTVGYQDENWVDGVRYNGDKSFTVNFNTYKVTDNGCVNDYLININNKGEKDNEITFTNGTIESANGCWATVCVGAESSTHKTVLNLNGMNIINENDASYSGNLAVRVRGTADVNTTVNVNTGTTITSDGASYGIAPSTNGAVVNINDGATIIQKNSGTPSGNSVFAAVGGKGTVNIYNGAIISSDSYGVHTMTTGTPVVNIYGGTITAEVALKASTNGGYGQSSTINVSGGMITGALEEYTDNAQIILTGGTFSTDVNEYCHEYYDAIQGADNLWRVERVLFAQTTTLQGGWNWYSSYVDLSTPDGLGKLQTALDGNGVQIKTQGNQFSFYQNNQWNSSAGFTSLYNEKMYMIQTTNDVNVELIGSVIDYANTVIVLNKGWNWISYPLDVNTEVNEALKNMSPSDGDIIKGYGDNTTSVYYTSDDPATPSAWWPSIMLNPGQGYMYKSKTNTSFTYAAGNGTSAKVDSRDNNYWVAAKSQYANNMTIIAMLSIDNEIVKGDYEIAAFANGECRGSARPIYNEYLDAYILLLTVYGDDVEELTFKYYDIDTDTEYELSNVMNYSNDAIVGTLSDPYIFSMNILGIGENSIDNINIYPNPTTTDREINLQAICDKVEVFNALGVKVAEYHNVDTLDAFETAGIYVIRITNDNAVKHCRLVVK